MFQRFILMLLLFALLQSCDNKIDLYADWKATPVVYGLIDPNNTTQYIRINKTYQAEDNANEIAGIGDSLYFDSLYVTLTDLKTGRFTVMSRTQIPKEPGIFSGSRNDVYTCAFTPGNTIRLDVHIPGTDKYFASTTKIFGAPVTYPRAGSIVSVSDNILNFFPHPDSWIYDVVIRFRYTEMNASDTTISSEKFADCLVNSKIEVERARLSAAVEVNFSGSSLVDVLATKIRDDATVVRKIRSIEYLYYGGGEELRDYVAMFKPDIGIIPKKKDYSNIVNGLGIFCCRNVHVVEGLLISDALRNRIRARLPQFIN